MLKPPPITAEVRQWLDARQKHLVAKWKNTEVIYDGQYETHREKDTGKTTKVVFHSQPRKRHGIRLSIDTPESGRYFYPRDLDELHEIVTKLVEEKD